MVPEALHDDRTHATEFFGPKTGCTVRRDRRAMFPEPTMIKLIAIEPKPVAKVHVTFSGGSHGTYDCEPFLAADTVMTAPLKDPAFFRCCFIEAGALAWPNGLELSAASLQRALVESGLLERDPVA